MNLVLVASAWTATFGYPNHYQNWSITMGLALVAGVSDATLTPELTL